MFDMRNWKPLLISEFSLFSLSMCECEYVYVCMALVFISTLNRVTFNYIFTFSKYLMFFRRVFSLSPFLSALIKAYCHWYRPYFQQFKYMYNRERDGIISIVCCTSEDSKTMMFDFNLILEDINFDGGFLVLVNAT